MVLQFKSCKSHYIVFTGVIILLNHACGMCVSVCVGPLRLLITSSEIFHASFDWLCKFYSFCIVSRCGHTIEAHCGNQPNKSKVKLDYCKSRYCTLNSHLKTAVHK